MAQAYIYTDKIGAGPEHPDKQWGLYSKVLTAEEAKKRYELNAVRRQDWFGVVPASETNDRPGALLQLCPRANGVVLEKLNEHGSIVASYIWVAYYTPTGVEPYQGLEDSIFLSSITWYTYPEEAKFFRRNQSLAHVTMTFRPDGYAKEERVTNHGFGQPQDVETREFHNVDVTANKFMIPEFGDWAAFFEPEVKGIK